MPFRRRVSSFRGFSRGARRQTAWSEGPGSGTATISSISATSQVATAGAASLVDRLTLQRIRGQVALYLNSVTAVNDGFVGAVAIGVAEADAFAVGVTALPSPITDYEEDWLWWMPVQLVAASTTTGTWAAGSGNQIHQIDTRAQRKLRLGDVVYGIIEVTEIAGASVMAWAFDTRMLVKLA